MKAVVLLSYEELIDLLFTSPIESKSPSQTNTATTPPHPNITDYFLFSYSTICTENTLFETIGSRFIAAASTQDFNTHIHLVLFIELWLNHNWQVVKNDESVQESLLDMLISIADGFIPKTSWCSQQLRAILVKIESIIEQGTTSQKSLLFKSAASTYPTMLNNLTNPIRTCVEFVYANMHKTTAESITTLAEQICLFEESLLRQIDSRGLLNPKKSKSPFLQAQIAFFDRLSNLMSVLVLYAEILDRKQSQFQNRLQVLQYLIALAFQLRLLNNYSASYSMYLGLQTATFLFPQLFDYIDILSRRRLDKLHLSFSSQQNLALTQNNSPLPAIPYIGIFFSQAARIGEIYKDKSDKFNMSRLQEQTVILMNIDQFRQYKYDFVKKHNFESYFLAIPHTDALKVVTLPSNSSLVFTPPL